MDANPESEQLIFNIFWAVFEGNLSFGTRKFFKKELA